MESLIVELKQPDLVVLPELLMEEFLESRASRDRLRDMDVTMVYPAHGATFRFDSWFFEAGIVSVCPLLG